MPSNIDCSAGRARRPRSGSAKFRDGEQREVNDPCLLVKTGVSAADALRLKLSRQGVGELSVTAADNRDNRLFRGQSTRRTYFRLEETMNPPLRNHH